MNRILTFCFLLLFSFALNASAENWYTVATYDYINKKDPAVGKTRTVRIVTLASTEEHANEVMKEMIDLKMDSLEWSNSYCVEGEKFDTTLMPLFMKTPARELYLHMENARGYQVVLDFLNIPQRELPSWGKMIGSILMNKGYKNIELIFPGYYEQENEDVYDVYETKKQEAKEMFTYGDSKEDVETIQGKPDRKSGNTWFYKYSFVSFDKNDKVRDVMDFSDVLKFKKEPK